MQNRAVVILLLINQGDDDKGKLRKISSIDKIVDVLTRSLILPNNFSLSQNYPNPFNPTTLIQYALKENVNVKITVYDILGRVVKTLVNEYQDAGYKSVMWDGLNEKGNHVSSGLYIYKIEAGNFVDSKKMLLLK